MYSTFGLSAEAKGVGIAGCRRGRFEITAFSGSRGRLVRLGLWEGAVLGFVWCCLGGS